jgi:peptidoglycan/LPS O-acetylase OafA/YrhL
MLLSVHYALGYLVVAVALAAIFWQPARRIVLYVLVLQILAGGIVWAKGGIAPPPAHWILAILNGGVYALANALERRGRPRALVLGTLVLGFAIFAVIFSLGMNAVRAQG